ncbi:MAG: hypothetical protein P8Q42_11475 [Flavobacteriales bacterium]|nr:hypothetical protein [Flavobacteriales bacterium]
MKKIKILVIICFILLGLKGFSNTTSVWLTYGQSKFVYSPGIEAIYKFSPSFGIQLGLAFFYQNYQEYQVVNISKFGVFNLYNGNLGGSYSLFKKGNHTVSVNAGGKFYYGPEFDFLHYYNNGNYKIYFDSAPYRFVFGMDFGICHQFKRCSYLLKFDTARNKFRLGLGYTFGKVLSVVQTNLED